MAKNDHLGGGYRQGQPVRVTEPRGKLKWAAGLKGFIVSICAAGFITVKFPDGRTYAATPAELEASPDGRKGPRHA